MKLIEIDDHRLTKVVSHLVDQRHDRHLILLWTKTQYLLEAFKLFLEIDLMSMAELIQAIKVCYLTVEGFVISNPLLSNLSVRIKRSGLSFFPISFLILFFFSITFLFSIFRT